MALPVLTLVAIVISCVLFCVAAIKGERTPKWVLMLGRIFGALAVLGGIACALS